MSDGKQQLPFSQVLKSPSDFLKQAIGQRVLVQLNSGTNYQGKLVCLDGYMNIALEQAEEWQGDAKQRSYGDAFIRGNNGKLLLVSCC